MASPLWTSDNTDESLYWSCELLSSRKMPSDLTRHSHLSYWYLSRLSPRDQIYLFEKLCRTFHSLSERKRVSDHGEALSCCMIEFRFCQAKDTDFKRLDLHWLTRDQAKFVLEYTFWYIKINKESGKYGRVEIIEVDAGVGIHSEDGPVLQPDVRDLLRENGILFIEEHDKFYCRV